MAAAGEMEIYISEEMTIQSMAVKTGRAVPDPESKVNRIREVTTTGKHLIVRPMAVAAQNRARCSKKLSTRQQSLRYH